MSKNIEWLIDLAQKDFELFEIFVSIFEKYKELKFDYKELITRRTTFVGQTNNTYINCNSYSWLWIGKRTIQSSLTNFELLLIEFKINENKIKELINFI